VKTSKPHGVLPCKLCLRAHEEPPGEAAALARIEVSDRVQSLPAHTPAGWGSWSA
jgi:hypothetical protein